MTRISRSASFGLLLASFLIIVFVTACVTKTTPTPEPRPTAVPIASTQSTPTVTPSPMAVPPTATPLATPSPTAVPPTATPVPQVVDEEDCMAGCHIPDPNEHIADGAAPQPASHIGRATCLVCHAAPEKPPLPATHKGRLDPSCKVCHVEAGAGK
ncbi:MAG: hypothetical protein HY782_22680 [Chloroflexi bacterium]|nr:hypothetical protein [Chloroflexota bacterium]